MPDDSKDDSGKQCAYMTVGLIVMIGGFFGGFMQFFWMDTHDVGTILFYVMVVPMISFLVGSAIIVYGMRGKMKPARMGMFGMMAASSDEPRERTYIHEPPRFCSDCGGTLSAETIEWVGPLTVKCPYCGATHATEKREV